MPRSNCGHSSRFCKLIAFLGISGIAFFVSIPPPVFGQLSSASVTGVVRDVAGAVVPGAKLTLKNFDTSIERAAQSNNAGNYVFLNITPGRYSLAAEAGGFEISRIPELTLNVNQTATIDINLTVGTLEQSVTVAEAGELVQSSTSELGAVVSSKQVIDLPLNGRNFTQLLSLTPGVAPVSVAQNSGGFGNVLQGSAFVFPAINGQTNRSNFFLTDGINNQGPLESTYAVPPIVDAIAEFKINSHGDNPEFGGVLGGVVNVATKSGTNQLHGTLWEYVRNNAFDARNTFQSSVTPYRQNQYGVSGGGPVMFPKLYDGRNKTFFFGAFQGTKFSQAANNYKHLPTDAELSGNLSGEAQAYNPFTTQADPAHPGQYIRDPFPGNQIPQSLITSPLVGFYKSIRPAFTNVGIGNYNAVDATPFVQDQNEYSARIDQNIGAKDFVWFRYSLLYYNTTQSAGLPGFVGASDNPGQNWGASWVHTFSPTLVLQSQFGRSHQETNSANSAPAISDSTITGLGFADQFGGNFIASPLLLPSVGINDFSTIIPGTNKGLNPNEGNIYEYKGNVTKIVGNHTFHFGGEFTSSTFEALYANANVGFAAQQTNNPADLSGGNAIASFLLNVPDNAGRRNVHETTRFGGEMAFYFQDSWKATPKLTVNVGLRYDRTFQPPYGTNATIGQNGGIETGETDFNNGTYVIQKLPPTCTERGHAPCIPGDGTLPDHVVVSPNGKIFHDTTTNFGPRVGLAYRLTNSMAVRAGFGIFYDNWAAVTQTAQNYEGDWPDIGQQLANNLNLPVSTQPKPSVTGLNPFASGAGAFPAATPFNQVQWMIDPYAKNPYSMQYNFGVAKQIGTSATVSVDYVGSGSRRLDVGGYYNVALTPGPGDPGPRQLYPYIHPTFYDRSIGRGNYNALQFLYDKRFSKGLAYQVSYTYSKSIDIGSDGWYGVEGFSVQDPYHINNDRSVAGFDLTHVLSVNVVYELPIGSGKRFATHNRVFDYIVGGWQVNAIGQAHSGLPFSINVDGDGANTGNTGYLRANLVGDPNLSSRSATQWFNTAAFQIPAIYTFGNSGRNILRRPAFWNVDTSLFRRFPLGESRSIEFRAESFNTPNTVILGQPGNNISESNFGVITGTQNSSRLLQLALKLAF